MPLLRKVPLKLRLPLMDAGLAIAARFRSRAWIDELISPGPLVVTGYMSESSGIAQGARLSVQAFRKAGFDPIVSDLAPCYRHSLKGTGRFPTQEKGGVWYIHANAQECLIALMAFPTESWRDRYRIAYWAWETTCAAPLWAWAAQYLHEIWVPSRFVAHALHETFRRAKRPDLNDRVRIMPHPVDAAPHLSPDKLRFGLSPARFEALCMFDIRSAATRKNPWAVIDAWKSAFPTPSDAQALWLKTQHLGEDPVVSHRLAMALAGRTDIYLIDQRIDAADIGDFIGSFDAIVSLHRSEGFGLPLAEAMAVGVMAVATGWSGNMDFMTQDNSYLVPYTLVPVSDPAGMYGKYFGRTDKGQVWAEPDRAAAAASLRMLTNDPDRAGKAERARQAVARLSEPWYEDNLRAMPFARHLAAQKAIEAEMA